MPDVVLSLSPAIIAASVAVIVAFLTPAVTSLRARRQAVDDKFDAAIAALLLTQAARHHPTDMPLPPARFSPTEDTDFHRRLYERGMEFFVEKTADAKTALAAVEKYVPEVRDRLTSAWELTEEDEPAFRAAIETRRTAALKAERLFRQRRPLPRVESTEPG